MGITRRLFLGAIPAGIALAAIPVAAAVPRWRMTTYAKRIPLCPVLYGDGEHDDADALEAALNGEEAVWSDLTPVGPSIEGKRFLIGRTITIREMKRSLINNYLFMTPEQRLAVLKFSGVRA